MKKPFSNKPAVSRNLSVTNFDPSFLLPKLVAECNLLTLDTDLCPGTLLGDNFQKLSSIVRFFFQIQFFQDFFFPPFIHLCLGKIGPFTLENHIHVKALKMQSFPNN
jgi:hypothetical protein